MSDNGENGGRGIGKILCKSGVDIDELPEGCISNVISLTSPRDAARCALVSKLFQSATDSDTVWKRLLPSDYQAIIDRSSTCAGAPVTNLLNSLSKKQLYLRLADEPILIDDGTKSFALDKWSGKKIYMLAARSLYIVWAEEPRYWTWTSMQDARFQEVAYLLSVCWLEIRGKIETSMLSPNSAYAAYLVFKMADDSYGFCSSLEASAGIVGGKTSTRNIFVHNPEDQSSGRHIYPVGIGRLFRRHGYFNDRMRRVEPTVSCTHHELPKPRPDGWSEVEIGEFFITGKEKMEMLRWLYWRSKAGTGKVVLLFRGLKSGQKLVNTNKSRTPLFLFLKAIVPIGGTWLDLFGQFI